MKIKADLLVPEPWRGESSRLTLFSRPLVTEDQLTPTAAEPVAEGVGNKQFFLIKAI